MNLCLSVGSVALILTTITALGGQTATATDWPQWRGPNRDGISQESGLMSQWPASGPDRMWQTQGLGAGYGSMAVAGDRIYLQMLVGQQSAVASLDRSTGRLLWSRPLGQGRRNGEGSGPRGTPTLDGGRLYVLTENGDLACLEASDGSIVWQLNILEEFGGRNISWLISESPLVDGNMVIVAPGGRGAAVVALDKRTGETLWASEGLSDRAGYASAIVADVGGVRTVMTLTGEAGVGLRARDGELMWKYTEAANRTANAATPVFYDNKVFYASAYGTGGGLLELRPQQGTVAAEEVYFTREMRNHHGGVVVVDGYLYGFNNSILTCLDFATGERMWRDRSVGKGSLVYADGHLYIHSENNVVGLVEATPERYTEKGRFEMPDQGEPSRAHPVISDRILYIRDQGTVTAYDVGGG